LESVASAAAYGDFMSDGEAASLTEEDFENDRLLKAGVWISAPTGARLAA
jgi:hypothetical protein